MKSRHAERNKNQFAYIVMCVCVYVQIRFGDGKKFHSFNMQLIFVWWSLPITILRWTWNYNVVSVAILLCHHVCARVKCETWNVQCARRPRKYYHLQDNFTLFDGTMVLCVRCPLHTCCESALHCIALCVCQRLHTSYHYIIVICVNVFEFGQRCFFCASWGCFSMNWVGTNWHRPFTTSDVFVCVCSGQITRIDISIIHKHIYTYI